MRRVAAVLLLCAACLDFDNAKAICRANGRCDSDDAGEGGGSAGGGTSNGGGAATGGGTATGGGVAATGGGASTGGGSEPDAGGGDAGTGGGQGGGFVILGNFAFVTAEVFPGNFGGVARADEICADTAHDAGLPGTFRAFVPDEDGGAAELRLGNARGWIRTDGKPFIDTFDDYFSRNAIFYPLVFDEHAIRTGNGTWTGMRADGGLGGTCLNWSSNTGSDLGTSGAPVRVDGTFVELTDSACNGSNALSCFAIDLQMPVTVTAPSPHRTAFLSRDEYALDAGLAQADAFCSHEAADAGLAGQYRALLSSHDAGAAWSRFTDGAPWARVDGPALMPSAIALLSVHQNPLDVTLNVSPRGEYLGPWNIALAWTGSNLPSDPGTLDCADWTGRSPDAGGLFGYPDDNSGGVWFGLYGGVDACSAPHHLYCLER